MKALNANISKFFARSLTFRAHKIYSESLIGANLVSFERLFHNISKESKFYKGNVQMCHQQAFSKSEEKLKSATKRVGFFGL